MDRLRAEADAVLVGAGTLRADNPPLHVRDPEMKAHRRSLGKPDGLVNVLVTTSAAIDPALAVLRRRRQDAIGSSPPSRTRRPIASRASPRSPRSGPWDGAASISGSC